MSSSEPGAETPGSRYYQGRIRRLQRGSESGVVRSATGREVPFEFRFVIMRGSLRRFDDLREGMPIGYDVGWTSSGLRVTVIHAEPRDDSQREATSEQQVAPEELADGGPEDGDIE